MDDFYSLALDKLDRYICLKKSDVTIPTEGDEESSSDEDDDSDDSDDESEEDRDRDEEGEEEHTSAEPTTEEPEIIIVADVPDKPTSAVSKLNKC